MLPAQGNDTSFRRRDVTCADAIIITAHMDWNIILCAQVCTTAKGQLKLSKFSLVPLLGSDST